MRAQIGLLTLAFFAPVAAGCISNEYVIPKGELGRLAEIPPARRGQHVHAIQEIGSRRADAVPAPQEFPYVVEAEAPDVGVDLQIDGNLNLGDVGPQGGGRAGVGPGGVRGSGRGVPRSSGGSVVRGTPSASGSGSGQHGVSSPSGRGHGSSGGSAGGSGNWGGGGGNIGEEAFVLAVALFVIAALAVVGLVASEGVRFDGTTQMSPEQPVHLQQRGGAEVVVPLADITREDVAATVEAKVMDDEGFGIRQLEHVLDRRGATFKLDFGRIAFEQATSTLANSGPVAHIQVGYFFTPSFGVLATAGLGGADDGLGAILTRHEFALEAQALPLALGPLRAGGYANGGFAMAATTAGTGTAEYGTAFGGGALFEMALTGRMALTLRAGGDLAHFDDGWSPAATLAGGIAIY